VVETENFGNPTIVTVATVGGDDLCLSESGTHGSLLPKLVEKTLHRPWKQISLLGGCPVLYKSHCRISGILLPVF
jgi:hypothetical protein